MHPITTHLRNQLNVWFTGTYLLLECLTKTKSNGGFKGTRLTMPRPFRTIATTTFGRLMELRHFALTYIFTGINSFIPLRILKISYS